MTDNRFSSTLNLLFGGIGVMLLTVAFYGWFAAAIWITEQFIESRSSSVFMAIFFGIPFACALAIAFVLDLRRQHDR